MIIVNINVDKSSVTVFTKGRSQPEVNKRYGNRSFIQTDSFVHLGIVYSYNLKDKGRVSQRLHKAKNALVSLSAQCVHAQWVNPKVSADIYSKVIIPIALYRSELWNNLTQFDILTILPFQHYAIKRIQGLPTPTRSDMAESMVGMNRLPSHIDLRKMMFLHKIISLPAGSVSRNIY